MAEQKDLSSLDDLEARIRKARERETEEAGNGPGARKPPQGLGLGMRLAVEVVSGVAIGCGLGYFLDSWLGTRPWLMVPFLLLGGAAGVMNAYRVARGLDATVGLGAAQRRKTSGS